GDLAVHVPERPLQAHPVADADPVRRYHREVAGDRQDHVLEREGDAGRGEAERRHERGHLAGEVEDQNERDGHREHDAAGGQEHAPARRVGDVAGYRDAPQQAADEDDDEGDEDAEEVEREPLERVPRLAVDDLVPALEIAREAPGQRRLVAHRQGHRDQELAPLEQGAELALAVGQRRGGIGGILRERPEPREHGPERVPRALGLVVQAPHELVRRLLEVVEAAPTALQRQQAPDHSPAAPAPPPRGRPPPAPAGPPRRPRAAPGGARPRGGPSGGGGGRGRPPGGGGGGGGAGQKNRPPAGRGRFFSGGPSPRRGGGALS